MIITVGSTNPTKIEAVKKVASELFKNPDIHKNPKKTNGFLGCQEPEFLSINCVNTPSSVSEMPMTDEETINGALNRAKEALKYAKSDYGVGIEGGADDTEQGMFLCAWVAVTNKEGKTGLACTGKIELPLEIAQELRTGKELGPLMDELTGRNGIKHSEGTYGILTMGKITRSKSFEEAITCAFMKFINTQYYK